MEKSTLAVLLVILACAVWSTMGVYSHVTHVSIMALTVIRLSIPTLLLTPLLQWRHVNRMAMLWHPWSLLIMALKNKKYPITPTSRLIPDTINQSMAGMDINE